MPPLQDLLLFLGPPELHVDLHSPAPELLVRVTVTHLDQRRPSPQLGGDSGRAGPRDGGAHVGVSPFILELGEPISTVAGGRHLGHFGVDFAVDNI